MFLGLDIGTGSAKALLLDESGRTCGEASSPYQVAAPQAGWSEIDANTWWQAIANCCLQLPVASRAAVKGIGLSGQMHGLVLCDAMGMSIRPAIGWMDHRAAPLLSRYPPDSLERLGNVPSAGMAGPMLLWLKEHEANRLHSARWAMQPKDWLRLRLTGEARAEASDASGTLLADRNGNWDQGLIASLGLPLNLFAPLGGSAEALGTLTPDAANLLGLRAGIVVAGGGGDTPVAAFGSGLLADGAAQLTTGSGAQIVVIRARMPTASAKLNCYRTVGPVSLPHWYMMAAMQNAGVALEWVRAMLGFDWPAAYAAAFTSPPARDDELFFLPYLSGERTPWMDSRVRGAFIGLSPGTDAGQMMRAAFLGVAFSIRAGLDALRSHGIGIDTLRLAGGGSVRPEWQQLLMDVLGVPLEAVSCPNASARGAAILGGIAASHWTTRDLHALAPGSVPLGAPQSLRYETHQARFCDLYARLADWYH